MPRRVLLALTAASLAVPALADHVELEELIVTASRDSRQIDVVDSLIMSPDASQLLHKAPGANVNNNGPLTGIPQYRGMYGGRISAEVNGMTLSSAGPNWMDPPLSYAPAAQLESLEVYRGIAPVSAGQETIGGAINAKTWSGDFGDSEEFTSSGRLSAGGQSVNDSLMGSAAVVVANESHRIKVAGMAESGDDAEYPDGNIVPSEYTRKRYDFGYGYQNGGHSIQFDVARQETGDTGTPALPMDIEYIDGDLLSLRYGYEMNNWSYNVSVYGSDLKHGMTNYLLRQPPMMNGMWRRNIATSKNRAFAFDATRKDDSGSWSWGLDSTSSIHNSDIDNPNAAAFYVVNFNDAERDVLGLFAERNQEWGKQWSAEFGLRYNRVEMDAGTVDGSSMMMMIPLRNAFNNAERKQTDNNFDAVAKVYFEVDDSITYYAGVGRKTRSPSYQERYLWLPMQSTAGLADGRTYTGNIDLDAEVSHEIEVGLDFQNAGLVLSPRIFYKKIDDYIQGTVSTNQTDIDFVAMMNGTNNPPPLEFNNVDATIYGFDMDWSYRLSQHWLLNGVVNYTRGGRDDIDDNLYRIAAPNTSLTASYFVSDWRLSGEGVFFASQNKVSSTNGEQKTAGYSLYNLRAQWAFISQAQLGFGVENVFDKKYANHLGGYNRASNPDLAIGEALPAYGRNLFVRVDYQW